MDTKNWPAMQQTKFTTILWGAGLVSLALGMAVYLACRSEPPFLIFLWTNHNNLYDCGGIEVMNSMPSALHAVGFTCLLGASLGGTRLALIVSGIFWFTTNALWEWACNVNFPWPHIRRQVVEWFLIQPGLVHACTSDLTDVFAAAVGAALPIALHIAFVSR